MGALETSSIGPLVIDARKSLVKATLVLNKDGGLAPKKNTSKTKRFLRFTVII